MNDSDPRLQALNQWLQDTLHCDELPLEPASEDASFRRYWRTQYNNQSWIIMDAPPDKEDCQPFINITERLLSSGVQVPEIHARDLNQGFLLLTDLGTEPYLQSLNENRADTLYSDAINALICFQMQAETDGLPDYNPALLQREMNLFPDWLLKTHLQLSLNSAEQTMLEASFNSLISAALEQPRVFVHRDYHSRNLMVLPTNNPGIIDYQDAVLGPVTYDLVSLLRDCYIRWPDEKINHWLTEYLHMAQTQGLVSKEINAPSFTRWFDLMGIQRHLKASGIFCRLNHRDNKPGYLQDIPRTLTYISDIGKRYPETRALADFVNVRVLPGFNNKKDVS